MMFLHFLARICVYIRRNEDSFLTDLFLIYKKELVIKAN